MPKAGISAWRAYQETLKKIQTGELQHASAEEKASAVSQIIRMTSAAAAVSTMQPLPFVDMALLTPMQHRMVQSIGLVHGYRLEEKAVRQLFRTVRQRIITSQLKIAMAKVLLIPIVPGAYADSVAYALTHALGQASDRYFRSRRTMHANEMKARFEVIYRDTFEQTFRLKRDELRAMFRSAEIRRQIDDLKEAQRHGKMDEAEEVRRMDAILGGSSRSSSSSEHRAAP